MKLTPRQRLTVVLAMELAFERTNELVETAEGDIYLHTVPAREWLERLADKLAEAGCFVLDAEEQ